MTTPTDHTDRITSRFGRYTPALDVVEGLSLGGVHAIVTGGASGLGYETTRALAKAGAAVTMAVRQREQGDAAVKSLQAENPQAQLSVATLDLADLASVRRFADDWLATAKPLHLLINNAGIMACPLMRTPAGWEMQFATNHLGHFALTQALLPSLLRAAPSRIVALSSLGHRRAGIDFDDLHFEGRPYDKWVAYGQAKSANALMALHLDTLHAKDGLTANAVHPGGIRTGLSRHLPAEELAARGWKPDDGKIPRGYKTPEQGASTSVWAATAPELAGHGGLYLEDCAEAVPATAPDSMTGWQPHIKDRGVAQRLWKVSADLVGG